MHGVIIWYSKADFQAIIWCEDSKDLGIATGPTSWRNPMSGFEIGDAVYFRLDASTNERRCSDIHLVAPSVAPTLHTSIRKPRAVTPKPEQNRLLHLCYSRD